MGWLLYQFSPCHIHAPRDSMIRRVQDTSHQRHLTCCAGSCAIAHEPAKYDILQVLLKEEAVNLPTPEKARQSSGSVSRRQATSCEPTQIPTPGHLKSICNCKAIVTGNLRNFTQGDTLQRSASALPLFVFPVRQFSGPPVKREERFSFCVRLPCGTRTMRHLKCRRAEKRIEYTRQRK